MAICKVWFHLKLKQKEKVISILKLAVSEVKKCSLTWTFVFTFWLLPSYLRKKRAGRRTLPHELI